MSKAIKCDRCGNYYIPSEEENETAFIPRIAWRNAKSIRDQKVTRSMDEIDLCPYCAEDFQLFLDGNPLATRTDICEENVRYVNSTREEHAPK